MENAFRELLDDFLLEARERLDRVEELLLALESQKVADRPETLETCRRQLHTLKGNSGMMGFADLRALAHDLEDQVEALDPKSPDVARCLAGVDSFRRMLARTVAEAAGEEEDVSDESFLEGASQELALGGVRVPFDRLDGLVEQLAEVLQYRNRLVESVRRLSLEIRPQSQEEVEAWAQLTEAHEALDKNLDFLQERIIQLRMVPLQTLFRHLQRIVHDESAREGKSVQLTTEGGSTPLDKALLEVASEALGHLVRNAVNHGIESPEVRKAAGKPSLGTISLTARVQGQEVLIEVADDGCGI
ncbi:MAG: Hpt domain-containing protein, partial [Acidobacteria bacterium]|nr:Hpt domain-containing protein [Acidobacteriota bacterium]